MATVLVGMTLSLDGFADSNLTVSNSYTGSTMNEDSAHTRRWEIAEVVFGVPFLMGIALHSTVPWSVASGIFRDVLLATGIALLISGIGVVVLARREFARYHQPTDPGQPTSAMIKTGMFAISRNPLYLGCVMIMLGIGLALNMLWTLVALLVSTMLCHCILIIPEEQYLAAKFGAEYQQYSATVHRWIGRT